MYPQPKQDSLWELAADMSTMLCAAVMSDEALECANAASNFEMAALHDRDEKKSDPAATLRSEANIRMIRMIRMIRQVTGKRPKDKFEASRLVNAWAAERGLKAAI